MTVGRNFPTWRFAGCPVPKCPGEGGILLAAAAAPSRWVSMANRGGGTWTDRGGPKSRPSILQCVGGSGASGASTVSGIVFPKSR